jgi:hypothetical protein
MNVAKSEDTLFPTANWKKEEKDNEFKRGIVLNYVTDNNIVP